MEPKPNTMNDALNRLRDPSRSTEQHFRDLAEAIEILVILGPGTDKRDLDADISHYRD